MNKTTFFQKAIIKPVINIIGDDDFLIDLAKRKYIQNISEKNLGIEKIILSAGTLNESELLEAFSGSLFSNKKLLIIDNSNLLNVNEINIISNLLFGSKKLEESSKVKIDNFIIFLKKMPKRLLDIFSESDLSIVECKKIKFPSEKINFIKNEFPTLSTSAIKNILDANFNSLEDAYLLANQITHDYSNEKLIESSIVDSYTDGKTGTTIYKIIDALVAGQRKIALKHYNDLFLNGQDKNKLINSLLFNLELKLSSIAKLLVSNNPEKDLGVSSWQIKKISNVLYLWTSEKLQKALTLTIDTDYKIKSGKTKAPEFEMRKNLLQISYLI